MAKRNRPKDNSRQPQTAVQAVRLQLNQVAARQQIALERGRPSSQIHIDINKILVSERARKAAQKSPLIISRLNEPQQVYRPIPLQQITTEVDRPRDNGLRLPAAKKKPVTQSPDKVRDTAACKSRPSKNKGKGGSKAFIPWCKR